MRHEEGGFFASFDADSEGVEGKYYVWTESQIREVLDPNEADLFISAYGISADGNFEGQNVLYHPLTMDKITAQSGLSSEELHGRLDVARTRLRKARSARIPPAADDKVITAWNGLLLISYAEAARALSRSDYLETAQMLAQFLLDSLQKDGELFRTWRDGEVRHTAYLEDHAALGEGLLTLYQTDFDPRWYQAAVKQADEILSKFVDPKGGFFDTHHDHETLITRPKTLQDNPIPSGNSLAISLFLKLASITGEARYSSAAETAILAMQDVSQRYPTSFSGWLINLDFAIGPQTQIAIVGSPSSVQFQQFSEIAHSQYLPKMVLAGGKMEEADLPTLVEGRPMLDDLPTAYLCQQFTCKRPTTSPEELKKLIDETLVREGS
jgi:uncharacterized protein YyaL (SSP411 family)